MCTSNDPIRVYADKSTAIVNGVTYTWVGGFGSVVSSVERGVRRGEVRMIGSVPFHAHSIDRGLLRKHTIGWSPTFKVDSDWILRFKAAIFGVS